MSGSAVVFCSLLLLIREHKRARCQAEIPLTALSEIVEPPLMPLEPSIKTGFAHNSLPFCSAIGGMRQITRFGMIAL